MRRQSNTAAARTYLLGSIVPSDDRGHKRLSPGVGLESSGESAGEDYAREKRAPKKRRKRQQEAGGEGRATQKKRKRKPQREEVDLSQLPPEEGLS